MDMSNKCDKGYEAMWAALNRGEITRHDFDAWYKDNCAKCDYMGEVCMCGEDKEVTHVTVRWWDGYMEEFDATEVRFGCDLLWMRLTNGCNRHIPLRQVRWYAFDKESHQKTQTTQTVSPDVPIRNVFASKDPIMVKPKLPLVQSEDCCNLGGH